MSTRPDLELALGLRGYERLIVIPGHDSGIYPDHWVRPRNTADVCASVNSESVVVIDRLDVKRQTLADICSRRPRLLALVPYDVEQEKSMRRMLSAHYPWAEVWTISTEFGKVLLTKDAVGEPYERDHVRDDRPVEIV